MRIYWKYSLYLSYSTLFSSRTVEERIYGDNGGLQAHNVGKPFIFIDYEN